MWRVANVDGDAPRSSWTVKINDMSTATLMSLEQFLALPEDGNVHELLEGEHLMSPRPKWWHVELQRRLQQGLSAAVSGACFVYQGMAYQLDSRTLLEPDVSVASAELIARAEPDGWLAGAPLVAVEIVSPSNRADELSRKVKVYLQAGTSEVWVIYPRTEEVLVYTQGETVGRYREQLRSAVLEGMQLDLKELFRR